MDNNFYNIFIGFFGVVVGSVITSIVAPYINNRTERLKNRAEAMDAVIRIESGRWCDENNIQHTDFKGLLVNLKAKAMIAGNINNQIVDQYLRISKISRSASQYNYYDDNFEKIDSPVAGSINSKLATKNEDIAEILIEHIANPRKYKITDQQIEEIKKSIDEVEKYKNETVVY